MGRNTRKNTLNNYFLIFFFIYFPSLLSIGDTQDVAPCECVPYYQCDENKVIKTGGQGLIDVRIPTCTEALEVCCLLPDGNGGVVSPQKPPIREPPPQPPLQNPEEPFDPFGQGNSQTEEPFDPEKLPVFNPDTSQTRPPPPTPRPPTGGPGTGEDNYPFVPKPRRPQGVSGCGLKRIAQPVIFGEEFRITGQGGTPDFTGFGEYPWMVAIFRSDNDGNNFVCGGSIIHPTVVLTGAHCISGKEGGTIRVRGGEWDTLTTNEPIPYQDRGVSRVIPHPEFDSESLYNDIALLILDSPFQITDSVDSVCVPQPSDSFDATNCIATGWGKNDFGPEGKYQTILRKVNVPLVERNECQERLRKTRLGKYFKLHQSFVCAGGIPQKDTCTGDGGGPLVCPVRSSSGEERYTQIGIVAWGIGCGNDNPAVYASVQHFYPWIKDHLKQL